MIEPRKGLSSCPVPSPIRRLPVIYLKLVRPVSPIPTASYKTMKIRNSAYAALIVGAFTVLAPIYGPQLAAAANPQDELEKSVKSLAGAYSILQQNFADPVSSEKAIYSGAIPGMLR